MTTALVPITDMERMAQAIAKSNLFGMKTPEQVLALMLVAQAEGRHPAIVARDYNIIQGRPAKTSEAMLRDFLEAGGRVEWHRLDDECADATFSHPQGGSARISWDLARAKKAGIAGKDNYAKYTRQMLRSRTVSEGCRTIYPAATSGMYEPGEVREIVKQDKTKEPKDMGAAEVVDSDGVITTTGRQPAAAQAPAADGGDHAEVSSSPSSSAAAGPPNETRAQALARLCGEAGVPMMRVLDAAGAKHPDEMSETDWADARAMLEKRAAKKKLAAMGEQLADKVQA